MQTSTEMTTKNRDVPTSAEARTATVTYRPRMDVYESDQEFQIALEMPGVDEKSIDITLERDVLTVVGQAFGPQLDGYRLQYCEYRPGRYERTIRLSEVMDVERIDARVNNGVLTITLPKSERARVRKIEVHVS